MSARDNKETEAVGAARQPRSGVDEDRRNVGGVQPKDIGTVPPKAQVGIELTVFSRSGGVLTKRISLNENGAAVPDGSICLMTDGEAERTTIADLHALVAVIGGLKPYQAIALGTPRKELPDKVEIVSKGKLNGGGAVTRTLDNFVFRKGEPALALLDIDRKGMPADVQERLGEFWATLVDVLPGLSGAAHLIRKSTSAGLYRTDTLQWVEGSGGLHVYVVAKDGSDVHRFLYDLHERAWLHGYGWWMIDKAGRLLERSIIDKTVGSPERLVFEAPPSLMAPLTQHEEDRKPIVHDGEVIDTRIVCPPLTPDERRAVDKIKAEARERIQPEANKVRAAYVEEHAGELAERTGKSIEEAREIIESQCGGVLHPDIKLDFVDEDVKGCTVADVLADPENFHRRVLADPIEGPSYGRSTAMILLRRDNDRPWIKSFAHGGMSYSLVEDEEEEAEQAQEPDEDEVPACSLAAVHAVFRKWFGNEYDLDACDVVCAVAASERLPGDPVWLMLVSGPGSAKTETVQATTGAGAEIISTITSEGALLSATQARGKKAKGTGGLLRKMGDHGVLVVKDFTSILSMDRSARASVLAALREVYDGRWVRTVGNEGGQTLEWTGRIVVIAAVTTSWDTHHAVLASMGDRFVLLRIDSNDGRLISGMQAIRNTGSELQMREELSAAVGGLVSHASTEWRCERSGSGEIAEGRR